jgi:ParB/RepB/Spo0J family partition protein
MSVLDLELQQLDERYSQLRVRSPAHEKKLLASMAAVGQRVPISVVPSETAPDRHVVVDGFRRIRALRQLRQDVVRAIRWEMSELEALLAHRSLWKSGGESILEQAWLLDALRRGFDLSMEELARRFDRSQSWVSRRLALVHELPESVQEEIRQGRIAPHAAAKYLVPVARAHRDHCERLARAMAKHELSTRDVGALYAGWRDGSPDARERLIEDPSLYLRALRALGDTSPEELGPREGLLEDVACIGAAVRRARKRMRDGAGMGLSPLDHENLLTALRFASSETARLVRALQEEHQENCHAGPECSDSDPRVA